MQAHIVAVRAILAFIVTIKSFNSLFIIRLLRIVYLLLCFHDLRVGIYVFHNWIIFANVNTTSRLNSQRNLDVVVVYLSMGVNFPEKQLVSIDYLYIFFVAAFLLATVH